MAGKGYSYVDDYDVDDWYDQDDDYDDDYEEDLAETAKAEAQKSAAKPAVKVRISSVVMVRRYVADVTASSLQVMLSCIPSKVLAS